MNVGGFNFGGVCIISASTHTLYIVVGEKISRWGIQFWGSVHHFRVHTYTLYSGWRKNIGDGGFNFGGAYIIFASTHTHYIVVGEKILEMGDSVLGERTSFLRPHIHST